MSEERAVATAPRGGLENLVRPVVAGLEAMIRAELEQADYGRFARIVRICNQAKSIVNIAHAKSCVADWDDEDDKSLGAQSNLGTAQVTTGGTLAPFAIAPGPSAPFASAANQTRELVGFAAELLKPMTDAQTDKERALARRAEADELRALVQARSDLSRPGCEAERAWVEGRIKTLTADGVPAAPGLGEFLSLPLPSPAATAAMIGESMGGSA